MIEGTRLSTIYTGYDRPHTHHPATCISLLLTESADLQLTIQQLIYTEASSADPPD